MLYYILEKEKVTAAELAVKFEVSVRTIYRDIDALSSAGIPIYASQGRGGGIEIAEDYILSKTLLSASEREQIMAALQGLASTSKLYDHELLTKLSSLFQVKQTNWIEVDFNHWGNDPLYEKNFHELKEAILGKHLVSFTYLSGSEQETSRCAKPARLLFKSQNWYLYAFCLLRNEFRYFKLSRIKDLEQLDETFADDFDAILLPKEIKDEQTIRLSVRFDQKVAFRVYDELSGEFATDDQGNLYAEIELPHNHHLYTYLLSFGDAVEVLEPAEIRSEMRTIIHKLTEKYKN